MILQIDSLFNIKPEEIAVARMKYETLIHDEEALMKAGLDSKVYDQKGLANKKD